jgi:hypothetical protein
MYVIVSHARRCPYSVATWEKGFEQLFNLGWSPDAPTNDQIAMGEIIFEEMQKKGKFPRS